MTCQFIKHIQSEQPMGIFIAGTVLQEIVRFFENKQTKKKEHIDSF
jgi:predicted nucleic-acid-binding protein